MLRRVGEQNHVVVVKQQRAYCSRLQALLVTVQQEGIVLKYLEQTSLNAALPLLLSQKYVLLFFLLVVLRNVLFYVIFIRTRRRTKLYCEMPQVMWITQLILRKSSLEIVQFVSNCHQLAIDRIVLKRDLHGICGRAQTGIRVLNNVLNVFELLGDLV